MAARIQRRRSTIHGNGVFATRDIPAGVRLIEYRGRLITHAQALRIYGGTADSGHTFLFTLNDRYVIDGNVGGNVARWINHSCDPNCEAVDEDDDGARGGRIMIITLRPIAAGEEITFDYRIELEGRHTARMKRIWACRCGSRLCHGTMLHPKRGRRRQPPIDVSGMTADHKM